MQKDCFAFDFGTLPRKYFEMTTLSNPAEAIRSEELSALLRLCGVKEENICSSDYAYFASVCDAFADMEGHPLQAAISSLLKTHFSVEEKLSPNTCHAVWKRTADQLFRTPMNASTLLPEKCCAWLCDGLTVPALPHHVIPVLDASLFLETQTTNLAAWDNEISQIVTAFREAGCQSVLLTLPYAFTFTMPDVYHVGQALSSRRRNDASRFLLIAQMLRILVQLLRDKDMRLHLRIHCRGEEAVALLSYVESSVGLPFFAWSASDERAWNALLAYVSRPMQTKSYMCLWGSDAPEKEECLALLRRAAARYPVGRICFAGNVDLRRCEAERTRWMQARKQVGESDGVVEKK